MKQLFSSRFQASLLALIRACLFTAFASAAQAQTTPHAPSAEQMIEQLKRSAPISDPNAPRTRSLRNLNVEAVQESTAAQAPARPSLSLLIQFDFNSARVKPESQQALANLAQALQSKELMEAKFAVEGHTDAKGAAEYNLRLSKDRAEAVRDFLVAQGVARARLAASGKGSAELANPQDPQAAENRRVRIVNLE